MGVWDRETFDILHCTLVRARLSMVSIHQSFAQRLLFCSFGIRDAYAMLRKIKKPDMIESSADYHSRV